jgi:chromosome partitioning protein
MYVVALASQKGGSGKTTLSGHLAVEAERAGFGPVALIDTDPQASLAEWWNAREAARPFFAKLSLTELPEALEELEGAGLRLAIIDTPPAITDSISRVIAFADLVLIPARPSPHDLRAVGATVEIAERNGKPVVFVINAATARARITGEAAVALSQHGTVAPVMLHQRVDFAASMVDGRTVGEVAPQCASAKEIAALWSYVQDRLARIVRDDSLRARTEMSRLALQPLSPASAQSESSLGEPAHTEPAAAEDDQLPEQVLALEPPPVPPPLVSAPPAPPPLLDFDRETVATSQTAVLEHDDLPPAALPAVEAEDNDRRSIPDRRKPPLVRPFGATERRAHPFGRRHTDRNIPYTSAK